MLDFNHSFYQFPQVSSRLEIQLIPTKLYRDLHNYISENGITPSIYNVESISFLIDDFEIQNEFDDWQEASFQLFFDIV